MQQQIAGQIDRYPRAVQQIVIVQNLQLVLTNVKLDRRHQLIVVSSAIFRGFRHQKTIHVHVLRHDQLQPSEERPVLQVDRPIVSVHHDHRKRPLDRAVVQRDRIVLGAVVPAAEQKAQNRHRNGQRGHDAVHVQVPPDVQELFVRDRAHLERRRQSDSFVLLWAGGLAHDTGRPRRDGCIRDVDAGFHLQGFVVRGRAGRRV